MRYYGRSPARQKTKKQLRQTPVELTSSFGERNPIRGRESDLTALLVRGSILTLEILLRLKRTCKRLGKKNPPVKGGCDKGGFRMRERGQGIPHQYNLKAI